MARPFTIEHSLFVDKFSIIMALIVGIIGSAICLYGIGYLAEYHEHYKEVKARPRYFFFLMYLFLSAMFGIVFSNNLMWIYFFWEITTLCSFLLIGYKDDQASRESAFRALNMNLLGGVVFAIGIVYLYTLPPMSWNWINCFNLIRVTFCYRRCALPLPAW